MSKSPSAPLKVSSAAATYTPATQDGELRSGINALLIQEESINKVQESLLHSLHANNANWPTVVQAHALALLRSGDVTNFPALLARVLEDVRQSTAAATGARSTNGADANGHHKTNGDAAAGGETPNLAVPQSVVDEALKVVQAQLTDLVEFPPSNGSS